MCDRGLGLCRQMVSCLAFGHCCLGYETLCLQLFILLPFLVCLCLGCLIDRAAADALHCSAGIGFELRQNLPCLHLLCVLYQNLF